MATVAAGTRGSTSAVGQQLYWADPARHGVFRSDAGGGPVEFVVGADSESRLWSVAVDGGTEDVYWSALGADMPTSVAGCVHRTAAGGEDSESLFCSPARVHASLRVDGAAGKLYWAVPRSVRMIQRANLDGSQVEDLVMLDSIPAGLDLDLRGGQMYWAEPMAARIQRANLDGSQVREIVSEMQAYQVAIDAINETLYFTATDETDHDARSLIYRAHLDGSEVEPLSVTPQRTIGGLAVDPFAGWIYWTVYDQFRQEPGSIWRARLDGRGEEAILSEGLIEPVSLVLVGTGGPKMDILPGRCPNHLRRGRLVATAVFGDAAFDVSGIDLASLNLSRLDGVGGIVLPAVGGRTGGARYQDVGSPSSTPTCRCAKRSLDGVTDLVIAFRSAEMARYLRLDEVKAGEEIQLVLRGNMVGGTPFAAADCLIMSPRTRP
jgi:low density lipoprotein receptor-related protein 5/6